MRNIISENMGTCEEVTRARIKDSTGALLAKLQLHHDYSIKRSARAIEPPEAIKPEPVKPVETWIDRQNRLHPPIKTSLFQVAEAIQRAVLMFYPGVTLADLKAPYRAKKIVRPRQLAMYLINELTAHTMPEIGRRFGGRDPTTVLHAVRKMGALCQTSSEIAAQAECVKASLGHSR